MAKTRTKTKAKARKKRRPTKAEIAKQAAIRRMIISFLVAIILLFGVIRLGVFGVTVYNVIRFFVGSLAYPAILLIFLSLFGFRWFQRHEGVMTGIVTLFVGLLLEWHAYLYTQPFLQGQEVFKSTSRLIYRDLSHFSVTQFLGGGMFGALLYKPTAFLFTNIGSFFIGFLIIAIGIFIISSWDLYDLLEFLRQKRDEWMAKHEINKQERFARREEKRQLALEKKEQEAAEKAEAERLASLNVDLETGEILGNNSAKDEDIPEETSERNIEIIGYAPEEETTDVPSFDESLFENPPMEDYEVGHPPMELPTEAIDLDDLDNDPDPQVVVDFTPKQHLNYKLPGIDLFAADKPKSQAKEKNIVRQNIKILEDTFKSFNIDVKVERAEIGPSVTKYEVKPAVGVRVNRISNLADDLALALAAKDVRIEAPIPGKSLVGIEVPNSEIATVSFRELWEQSHAKPENLLEIPLGKAVNGTARSFDLSKMPHLLVAGSTGSGKSVAVNGIISSILMKARPDQVKFLMVDPKMVELSVYNDIPHLLIPVVTNPRKASKALQKVVDEMENRYELFSKFGVRNIAGYNAKVESWNATSEEKHIPLPLIVVIVDELADLMMVASKEVEDAIIRLGQKARAAGIHMILATQRPSVDVISGLIKANVPSRVAFAVSSGTDSRTILDENGAEKLLGRGDMLFKPIDENHPVRLQGSFISDDDVERIVTFIKDQAEAEYDESFDPGEVTEADMAGSGGGGASEGDPLFEEAKALVLETQKASASMIQRRLSVGFNRATRLMEELEEAGVIGPAEGTKPRKVLQPPQ
ncbi:DNA translocase FtsK [Streptococcus pluranimalium]|uniref:DNA translocase FtsK n=1 Tax=Streptococcus pluranimalium TaxID=82348 RepID=UPI0024154D82|nr:DNA translocase FtsK [Streptococcus pluranimalium]WFM80327.1 DNA translocase FtsK [Streptococcus pluranimalium]